jgi:hypothetical protein
LRNLVPQKTSEAPASSMNRDLYSGLGHFQAGGHFRVEAGSSPMVRYGRNASN